jgi:hypothetical protein
METQKPKKALRGLFSRTEPEITEPAPSPSVLAPSTPINSPTALTTNSFAPLELTPPSTPTSVPSVVPDLTSSPDPVIAPSEKKHLNRLASAPTKTFDTTVSFSGKSNASSIALDEKNKESEVDANTDTSFNIRPPSLETQSQSKILPPVSPTITTKEEASAPYSFVKIQYNLDGFKAERTNWKEADYISFIHRIDQAQTDAFFLKGKLIAETKERFYLNSKQGWAVFCD